ncbi:MAG: indolepyruvate ferredoxin oxidoreductase subunit beta [Candidatus Thermoplasmatota archaeon]|nr:indolepyruvate ferredoxin oxidoreductase subunit beta [Candidatus Thermoplasmatota archaeon]MDD5778632.1 indolepyruvate ferredoxin oxidoreductase subunit beta [Candidatus Thermoplasmatota archaeon]
MKLRLQFTGVGGQGVLTGANTLAKAFLSRGENVLMSEVHGMAQRGGSVVCTVCVGRVYSPLIADGAADALVSMEPVEALRSIAKLKPGGVVLTDVNPVIPANVSMGYHQYPPLDAVLEELESRGTLRSIDALALARQAGHAITKNIVMLGGLAATDLLPLSREELLDTVKANVPPAYVEMNEEAFTLGYRAVQAQR